ncbi:hypothetical protein D3OALGA1CA_5687 [Olavius algarvensis associated proteobacterium Delta 3]|nr:hypothetical protein D3OALGB2SA_3252 [Olavius algarvensis associated proteobacterium Delta 3]CAB5170229.1 hypothetical protein D3OALGA1CA_5687 [Olavius algarvensis associated proteobacterium Delta 3]
MFPGHIFFVINKRDSFGAGIKQLIIPKHETRNSKFGFRNSDFEFNQGVL